MIEYKFQINVFYKAIYFYDINNFAHSISQVSYYLLFNQI